MSVALKITDLTRAITCLDLREEIQLLKIISEDIGKKINKDTTENEFLLTLGQKSLDKIWDNQEDEVYSELLKR